MMRLLCQGHKLVHRKDNVRLVVSVKTAPTATSMYSKFRRVYTSDVYISGVTDMQTKGRITDIDTAN